MGRITSAGQVETKHLPTRGAPITCSRSCTSRDSAEELRVWGKRWTVKTLSGQVTRQMGTNTVQTTRRFKSRVELLKKQVPPGVHCRSGDISNYTIKESVDSLLRARAPRQLAGAYLCFALHP